MLKKRAMSKDRWTMTLPDERYRAVLAAERLLKDLCDPSKTPRVPKTVRQRASSVLRHYPSTYEMNRASIAAPDIFAEQMEDLHRFIARGRDPAARDPGGDCY